MICIIVIILIIICFNYGKEQEAAVAAEQAEFEKKEKERKERIYRNRELLDSKVKNVKSIKEGINYKLISFFRSGTDGYLILEHGVKLEKTHACQLIKEMEDIVEKIKNDVGYQYSNDRKRIEEAESEIGYIDGVLEIIRELNKKTMIPLIKMVDKDDYGKINKKYWNKIISMNRNETVEDIKHCEKALYDADLREICSIDNQHILDCVWFFALETPFSASDFNNARSVFEKSYRGHFVELQVAELYAKMKVAGEDVVRDTVRDSLKNSRYSSDELKEIGSGLMCMNAYRAEHMVLQHMIANGKEMDAKTQERLHSLTNGGGKAPSGFDVTSSNNALYFDVSALAWKDDEYVGLFENLAFQDKSLTYSLAIRDEDKDLFIAQGINVPETKIILNKFKDIFEEEYGTGVVAQQANCITLSGSGQEKMEGILVSSGECKQMGILIHIARIGKKLIIKFYTLFMPTDSDLATQKQQALSMYKKLSPSVAMWESSLKDTMLMAVEQLLNASVSPEDSGSENVPADGELVF